MKLFIYTQMDDNDYNDVMIFTNNYVIYIHSDEIHNVAALIVY